MPANDASALRRIIEERRRALGLSQEKIVPDEWSGFRRLQLVLQRSKELAYVDGWHLVDFLASQRFDDRDGASRPFLMRVIGNRQRATRRSRDEVLAQEAWANAFALVDPPKYNDHPAVVIASGETGRLVAEIERVLAAHGIGKQRRDAIRRPITSALKNYEWISVPSPAHRALRRSLEDPFDDPALDRAQLLRSVVRDRPSGDEYRNTRVNPWPARDRR